MAQLAPFRSLGRGAVLAYRIAMVALGTGLFALILLVLALRYWILPNADAYRNEVAALLTQAVGQPVTVGRIVADWDGFRPHLSLAEVTLHDRAGRPALTFAQVDNTLSWRSLVSGELRFHSLEIDQPRLNVRRDGSGVVYVAGIALNQPGAEGGFADWVLRQYNVIVRNATLIWEDELKGAPPLVLSAVDLRLRNSGSHHQFGLRGEAPAALASELDLRGDLIGGRVLDWQRWRGELFAQLGYVDLAAWRPWLTLPAGLSQGVGAVRLWLGVDRGQLADATADLRLAEVKTRLAPELRALELASVAGRVGWKRIAGGFQVSTRQLALTTRDGISVPPTDFLLSLVSAQDKKPARGEIVANALDLGELADLAQFLPLEATLRTQLSALAPRGRVYDLALRWTGAWPDLQSYSVRGRFAGLALKPAGEFPGFSGLSGSVSGTEAGGAFNLASRNAVLALPKVFQDPLAFEILTVQGSWVRQEGYTEIKFSNVSFANADLAGNVYGAYRTAQASPGIVDLTGSLTRADGQAVARYLPRVVNDGTRHWLKAAIQGGRSNDVRLRLKGNLADFPFADGSRGIFQVAAKVDSGVLDYAQGWPRIENISADLLFRGARMEIRSNSATLFGTKLERVLAVIPDLKSPDEVLEVQGEAKGPTSDFLKFIEKSPVNDYIEGFTEGMTATGPGELRLSMKIPLRHTSDTRVAGTYRFVGNRIAPGGDFPELDQVNGRLVFSESKVTTGGLTAQILGGPASLSAATQPGGVVRINASGRVNADALRQKLPYFWAKYLKGGTDWRGTVAVKKKAADFVIESSLQGLSCVLPAPFAKAAAEAIPLRIEKKTTGPGQDLIAASYGKRVSALFQRRQEHGEPRVERGGVSFGAAAALPKKAGIWVNGSLPELNLDAWRSVLAEAGAVGTDELSGIDVRIARLEVLDKRFNDLTLYATPQKSGWQATVAGPQLSGEILWQRAGEGKVVARLKSLVIPPDLPGPRAPGAPKGEEKLPALDVAAESLTLKERPLGRLDLLAVPQRADWRIEKLVVSNPDSTFSANGLWQGWATHPRTRLNIKLEVSDIGKFLARFGYPSGVKGGKGDLTGSLSWAGSPQSIDYPSLTGDLELSARNGQFVKLEPGIGKLLGILSLQALPRRITLDFKDIFSEGFSFDEIAGTLKVQRGVITTDNFRIQGPSARVLMSGEVDLPEETQNLRVKVIPALGESVSVAGALLGHPVVGITAFVLQKMLKDPLDQLIAYEYNITGTWSDPIVSKIPRQAQPAQ